MQWGLLTLTHLDGASWRIWRNSREKNDDIAILDLTALAQTILDWAENVDVLFRGFIAALCPAA